MRKIAYFPSINSNELLYGAIGRYQFIENITTVALTERLFNKPKYTVQIDHLGCLKTFCNNLGNIITPEEILRDHSLIDIYLPFMESNQEDILNMIVNGDETYAGQFIRPNRPKGQILYCPKCVEEDVLKYGETYIHREHQIPNVLVCYKHGLKLMPYFPDNQNAFQRIDYTRTHKSSIELSEVHFDLAKASKRFLNFSTRGYGLKDFQGRYRELFKKEGYINTTQILRADFADEFINFFGVDILETYIGNLIRLANKQDVVSELNRLFFGSKLELSNHLLLLLFFNIPVEQFFNIKIGIETSNGCPISITNVETRITEDDHILEKLMKVFWQIDIDNKYKAITFDIFFRAIKIPDWRDKIIKWPKSLEYLKSVCQTSEDGLLRQCKDFVDRYRVRNTKPLTIELIRGKCKLYNEERVEQFENIKQKIQDYINKEQVESKY